MILKFPKEKLGLLRTLVTEQEIRTVLENSLEDLPEHALYKVGDAIHALVGGIIPTKLTVYGARAGGYGTVYTVLDEHLRRYCLKLPRFSSVDDEEAERIRREARLWLRLGSHQNIAYAYSVLEVNGSVALMIEYLSGRDLSFRMAKKRLSIQEAIAYAIQICRGLSYAQARIPGFVHGDIKPSNCLLAADGTLKVTDFGQVRTVEQPLGESGDVPASFEDLISPARPRRWAAGTPAYMAPEQFDATAPPDAKTDIYSFGITLFEMVTGQKPFPGRYHAECFEQHTTAIPNPPVSLNRDVPLQLSDLILRCMSKLPSERPQDFSIIEQDLAGIYREEFEAGVPQTAPGTLTAEETIAHSAGLFSLGEHAQAIEQLDHLLKNNPESASAWAVKGKICTALGRNDDAETCLARAVELDRRLAFGWSGMGEVLIQQELYQQALGYFQKAIALDSQVPAFWYQKGIGLFKLGHVRDAAKCFRRALKIDSRQAVALSALGDTQFDVGEVESAIRSYESAVALDWRCIEPRIQLANAYYSCGLFDRAIDNCRAALALRPANLLLQARLNAACRALYTKLKPGNEEEAEELFSLLRENGISATEVVRRGLECLARSNHDPWVFYLLASKFHNVANKIGHPAGTTIREALLRINIHEVSHRSTLYWLGRLFYRIGDYDSCTLVFNESVARLGGDDKSLYYLALCCELKQDYQPALDYYRQVLAIDPRCDLSRQGVKRLERLLARPATSLLATPGLVADNALADVRLAAV